VSGGRQDALDAPGHSGCSADANGRLSDNKPPSMSAFKWFIAGCTVSGGLFIAVPQGLRDAPAMAPRVAVASAASAADTSVPSRVSGLPDFAPLIERVGPSVVNVTTRSIVRDASGIAERHFDVYR
jgi:hypothetical protein